MKIILLYSSIDGQTLKICSKIQEELVALNHNVALFSILNFRQTILDYDKIIIASSIRYGKHNIKIVEFIHENVILLNTKKAVFISVNLVARKDEKSQAHTNPYVIKFLNSVSWKPKLVGVFAGKIDYKKYTFFDRTMIKLIMLMTHGPTHSDAEIEYTNWSKVTNFAKQVDEL
ncbi:MAG: menaquinone-dependent protoporphyrinogen IX dehydrogenase [Bacteroidetes bacterium HGW-Bacteroidetes-2]|jgi:menaquinone-dependent protoporphyrinogen oxidase|nr:MAG: menaquinone-dependent protoporphyrinogen IX dehydrogenase [Bacteroidetes bacterium HGW-Bacteroidetes-2]